MKKRVTLPHRINARLDSGLVEAIDKFAEDEGIDSKSNVIRKLLEDSLVRLGYLK